MISLIYIHSLMGTSDSRDCRLVSFYNSRDDDSFNDSIDSDLIRTSLTQNIADTCNKLVQV